MLDVVDGSRSPQDLTKRVCVGRSIHLVDPYAVNANYTFHPDHTFLSSKVLVVDRVWCELVRLNFIEFYTVNWGKMAPNYTKRNL